MRKTPSISKLTLVLITLLLITLLCTGAYQHLFNKCFWWECAPTRSFSIFELNLPSYLFATNADIESLHFIRNDLSADPAVASIQWDDGIASYSILKFQTNSKASFEYEFQVKSNKFTRPANYNNAISELLEYKSTVAEESAVQCGYVLSDLRCVFIAQYEEFIISFNSTIEPIGMPGDNFIKILTYIDNKMENLLKEGE